MKSRIDILLKSLRQLALVAIVTTCFVQQAFADVPDGISVSVKASQAEYGVKESLMLTVSYTNTTDYPIKMLKWGTALEGRINDDFLSVLFEGKELAYVGLHIKRAPASSEDYVSLKANEVLSGTVDLLTGYGVDWKGSYEVMPRGIQASGSQKLAPVTFKLLADRPILFKRTPRVNNCPDGVPGLPNNRFGLIDPAVSSAEGLALRARNDMRNTPISQRPNARRYREWFGVYSAQRWNAVQSHFDLIYNAVRLQTLVFICEDNESYFAAVFPSRPYEIFLGRAFWSAPRVGTDSKAGTIIHELSHFNILGGTDDNAYGQFAARNLANANPQSAVNNADSHEYFAENTPFLSMPKPAPDLLVKSINVSSESIKVKEPVSILGSVENIGNATSSATQLSFRISNDARITTGDAQIAQSSFSALGAGLSSNFQVNANVPDDAGQYWLGVCITPVNGEVETSNNCSKGVPITVESSTSIASILLLLLFDDE